MSAHPYFVQRSALIQELGFRAEAMEKLQGFISFLWRSNVELNLFSRKMAFEELIDNHLIDCLLPLPYFPPGVKKAADFGTGGGFPAVVYALQFPEMDYHLFEKSPKKQVFLQKCRSFAPNMIVHGDIPQDLKGVELVTARAFKPLDVILQLSRSYYEAGGQYFLLKARKEKIEEEAELARKKFNDFEMKLTALHSPIMEVERHLVQINPPVLATPSP